ncbi:MAG: ABC transporter ATP-binding protein [Ilumatobacteraceae bacterium]
MEAIRVEGVSKTFRLHSDMPQSVKERILHIGRSHTRTFAALKHLDLSIGTGETVGVMGHNGSGKSTLLKCMTGILTPSTGRVLTDGRVAALIELGAGFHPDMTGRENINLNGSILGLPRKDIQAVTEEIIEFSGLGDFINDPVKHYSSGMYVRLGFAVAVNLDPEVLLVDEVLAVGDELFQRKCLDRVREFQQQGRTIVVVTHSADLVRQMCQRAVVLDHGSLVADTRPSDAIRIFREHLHGELHESRVATPDGTAALRITDVSLTMPGSDGRRVLRPGEPLDITVRYEGRHELRRPSLTIDITAPDGQVVHAGEVSDPATLGAIPANGALTARIAAMPLQDGTYVMSFSLADRDNPDVIAWRDGRDQFDVVAGGPQRRTRGLVSLDIDVTA